MHIKSIQKIIDKIRGKNKILLEKIQNNINTLNTTCSNFFEKRNQIVGGQRWELELKKRYENKLYLDGFGYKIFSQNDEDGIINEIFNRIGTTNKKFIEFGVQDGIECNSHLLLDIGWKGLWIDGNENDCKKIKSYFKTSIENENLTILNDFITKDNINDLFKKAKYTENIDFLSVDIDGMDWHVLKSILEGKVINPRVICVEYNPLIPPAKAPNDYSTDYVLPYKEDWIWFGDDSQGGSLSAYYHLCRDFGYSLVGTCVNGVNAFFIKKELVEDKFVSDEGGALVFYNPWRHKKNEYLTPFADGYCDIRETMSSRQEIYKKNNLI